MVQSPGQGYVADRLRCEKADSLWHEAKGQPDSVAPESNCGRYRNDVGVQRNGPKELDSNHHERRFGGGGGGVKV